MHLRLLHKYTYKLGKGSTTIITSDFYLNILGISSVSALYTSPCVTDKHENNFTKMKRSKM